MNILYFFLIPQQLSDECVTSESTTGNKEVTMATDYLAERREERPL